MGRLLFGRRVRRRFHHVGLNQPVLRLLARAVLAGLGLLAMCVVGSAAEPQPSLAPKELQLTVHPAKPLSVTGGDDLTHLRHLASGVGQDHFPTAATTQGLKPIGIKTIRCINIVLPGHFDAEGQYVIEEPNRLSIILRVCRETGARPHVVMFQGFPPSLSFDIRDLPPEQRGLMGNQTTKEVFGPSDWTRFRAYCKAHFQYVLIDQGFADAEFEVGNEPDVGGTPAPRPPRPPNGSATAYQTYLDLYRNTAQVAVAFEQEHPGVKVHLGGPALAWAFTFRYGEFNWASRFLRDCGQQKIKLDFVGLHFYGNISSLSGAYPAHYPAFTEMLADTKKARDQYVPGTPIFMTEWGPSYITDNSPAGCVNAGHVGTAWCAAFLDTMLAHGVDSALYLATTDLTDRNTAGKWENVWGWPSFFVNPELYGHAYPKSTYHLFSMIHRLAGQRVTVDGGNGNVGAIAAADAQGQTLRLLLWNFAAQLPEAAPPIEKAVETTLSIRVADARQFFGVEQAAVRAWLIADGVSDAFGVFQRGETLTQANTALQQVKHITTESGPEGLTVRCAFPPSSVCLIRLIGENGDRNAVNGGQERTNRP